MINLDRLRAGPESPQYKPPRATDQEVRDYFSRALKNYETKIANRFRFDLEPARTLFRIDGEEEESLIAGDYGHLRVEHERIQTLGIESMVQHGLDLDHPLETEKYPQGQITFELTIFPSWRKHGMVFVRYLQYMTDTEEPTSVRWSVKDAGPAQWWDRVRNKRKK